MKGFIGTIKVIIKARMLTNAEIMRKRAFLPIVSTR